MYSRHIRIAYRSILLPKVLVFLRAALTMCILAPAVVGAAAGAVAGLLPGLNYVGNGYLPVTSHGAIPDDDLDDTAALQAALDAARDRGLVAFFPPGVYLVSDTLKLMQPVVQDHKRRWKQDRRKANAMVGSTQRKPPVLKLVDNAQGFDDPNNPKPLVWFWAQPRNTDMAGSKLPQHEQPNISFNQVFVGIDIDLRGEGHAGAVGIRHAGSQGSAIENVTVWAGDAYSGFFNIPGQGGGAYNVSVLGGRFGIWADHQSRYPVVAGLRLKDQSEAAIFWKGQSNLTIAGFSIERTAAGPAVTSQPGRKAYNRALTLVDGLIRGSGQRSIDNSAGRNLYLQNVHISGFDEIVESPGRPPVKAAGPLSLVQQYSYTGADSKAVIEAKVQGSGYEISSVVVSGKMVAAETLIERHLWSSSLPSFEDADAVSIVRYGAKPDDGKDDTEAILTALAKHDKVFVPRGTFNVRATLQLRPSTHFFGVAKHLSVIRADSAWESTAGTPVITTSDDPGAVTTLSFMLIERPAQNPGLTLLEWRAGRKSVVRDVMGGQFGRSDANPLAKGIGTYAVKGNGGGRWYGLSAEWNRMTKGTRSPGYRNLLVNSTSEPLSFYGLNIERGLSDPQAEILNSRNVSIYYLKGESLGKHGGSASVLQIKRSDNVSVFGYSGNARPRANAVIKVLQSNNILLANVMPVRPGSDFKTLLLEDESGVIKVEGLFPVSVVVIGEPKVVF